MPQLFILSLALLLNFTGQVRAEEESCKVEGGGSEKLRACVKAHCEAKKACTAAAQDAVKKSNDAAAATGEKFKKNDEISKPADASSQLQSGTSQLLQKAIASCDEAETKECKAKCKPDGADPKDKPKMQKELSECKEDIAKLKQPLGAGKTDAEKAAEGSKDTNKESNGQGAPQMPQSQDKDKDKSDASKDSPTAASPASSPSPSPSPSPSSKDDQANKTQPPAAGVSAPNTCSGEGGFTTACLDTLKAQCSKGPSDVCTQFTNRFCGMNGVSGGMEGADDIKAGSGAGDQYCTTVTAKSFCGVGGRDSCDTCRKLRNLPTIPAAEQPSACGIDPSALPTLQKNGSSASLGTASMGGGGGGGSGGGSSGAAAGPATAGANAVKENPYDKVMAGMNTSAEGGGGGGGGGGSGGSESAPDSSLADLASGYGIIGRKPSNANAGTLSSASVNATDIAVGGPRVFGLVEEVYRARCAANKANNCPPRP